MSNKVSTALIKLLLSKRAPDGNKYKTNERQTVIKKALHI